MKKKVHRSTEKPPSQAAEALEYIATHYMLEENLRNRRTSEEEIRGQRPTVMGRKNFLFSKTNHWSEDNAVIYSLLGSYEILGVNPIKWLEYVLTNMRPDNTVEELVKLLPYNFK